MTTEPAKPECQPRDRPVRFDKITPEMIRAGEAVLNLACEAGEIWPPSYSVLSSARDVYVAMELARLKVPVMDNEILEEFIRLFDSANGLSPIIKRPEPISRRLLVLFLKSFSRFRRFVAPLSQSDV